MELAAWQYYFAKNFKDAYVSSFSMLNYFNSYPFQIILSFWETTDFSADQT